MQKPVALIVEDHEDHTIIFKSALEMAGFETEVVMDGESAQKRLSETVPDVVILDLHIPKVSGETILHQMRADERFAETRVVVTTADQARAELLGTEADLLLVKPVSFAQLRALAETLVPKGPSC